MTTYTISAHDLDHACAYIARGLLEGAYRETVGGDANAERLLARLETLRAPTPNTTPERTNG